MSADNCYPKKRRKADELLTTLSDPVRREIIHYFENYTEEATESLDALATHLADRLPAKTHENLVLELPQTHLSRLEADGWLSYDEHTGHVTYHGSEEAKQLLTEVCDMF